MLLVCAEFGLKAVRALGVQWHSSLFLTSQVNMGEVLLQFCFFCKGSIGYAKGMLSVGSKEAHDCGEWNNNK